MESDQGGELGDIIRASSGCRGTTHHQQASREWQLPCSGAASVPASPTEDPTGGFGDPFSNLCRDPLLQELAASTGALHSAAGLQVEEVDTGSSNGGRRHDRNARVGGGDGSTGAALLPAQKGLGEEMARPCNIFSRFLQISPTANDASDTVARRNIGPPILVHHGGLQISSSSSSPQAPGTKRRKSQAKKVVCIPAPAASGSRPSGEVVPSDLWAWRKYGQKPIKGSPYPRGYYRCSSSKGCSARKQVERSRADPNMLVITYTSEHNHPWPTQRNPLAGSTRPQPARRSASSEKPLWAGGQEERRERMGTAGSAAGTAVKEEGAVGAERPDHVPAGSASQQSCCMPSFPESFHYSNDFFSELGELDPDPMELDFSKEFLGEKGEEDRGGDGGYKALDPFGVLDWVGNVDAGDGHCTKDGGAL